jgi:hypothetical protein
VTYVTIHENVKVAQKFSLDSDWLAMSAQDARCDGMVEREGALTP